METSELLKEYAAYDLWANRRFVERLSRESDEVLDKNIPSSFPSLRATVLHIRDAEHAWLKRLLKQEYPWPAGPEKEVQDLIKHCTLLHDHVLQMTENDLMEEIDYRDTRGGSHKQPAWQMVMHCFNHSTQHRGQLITMMRAIGLDHIPANDLITYQRSLKATY